MEQCPELDNVLMKIHLLNFSTHEFYEPTAGRMQTNCVVETWGRWKEEDRGMDSPRASSEGSTKPMDLKVKFDLR